MLFFKISPYIPLQSNANHRKALSHTSINAIVQYIHSHPPVHITISSFIQFWAETNATWKLMIRVLLIKGTWAPLCSSSRFRRQFVHCWVDWYIFACKILYCWNGQVNQRLYGVLSSCVTRWTIGNVRWTLPVFRNYFLTCCRHYEMVTTHRYCSLHSINRSFILDRLTCRLGKPPRHFIHRSRSEPASNFELFHSSRCRYSCIARQESRFT